MKSKINWIISVLIVTIFLVSGDYVIAAWIADTLIISCIYFDRKS